jgi:hypothetical protein
MSKERVFNEIILEGEHKIGETNKEIFCNPKLLVIIMGCDFSPKACRAKVREQIPKFRESGVSCGLW